MDDVLIFTSDGKPEPLTPQRRGPLLPRKRAGDYESVPSLEDSLPPRVICDQSAVALGGLAGNNALGAGFLEALRRSGKVPRIITCTSGQLRYVSAYLAGENVQETFLNDLHQSQPFGRYVDANLLFKLTFGVFQRIRPSVFEFPFGIARTTLRSWQRFFFERWHFSMFRELSNVLPAQSLVCQDPNSEYNRIADIFNAPSHLGMDNIQVGVIFNAYNYKSACEIVYMNKSAQDLTGKTAGTHNPRRTWVVYKDIDGVAVKDALHLYEYGFDSSNVVDGAYIRDIILSEVPDQRNNIIRIAVVRPQADMWMGDRPLSWVEMKDLQTEVNFNGTYFGERERIRLVNQLAPKLDGKEVTLLELPLDVQRGWWDYVLEEKSVFNSGYWRGIQLISFL